MKNKTVVNNWLDGVTGSSEHLTTDGLSLFSYQMKIGQTMADGSKQVLNVMSPNFYSQTTSHHVSLAKCRKVEIIEPVLIRNGWSVWYMFPA